MLKRGILYLVIALALVAAGFALTRLLIEEPASSSPRHERPVKAEGSAAPVEPAEAPDASPTVDAGRGPAVVEVLELKGVVTAGDDEKGWAPVRPGQTLAVDDEVRTEEDAGVKLRLGERSTMEVAPNARVQVRELTDTVQRLGLLRGRASVDYAEGGDRVLKIENADGSAVAKVSKGRFSVLSSGRTVAVATEVGQVDLFAAGERVAVVAGTVSVAGDGKKPTRPKAISAELILKVADPGCIVQRELSYTLRGKTGPGAVVHVNGRAAEVERDGRFSVRVPLKLGKNKIIVVTEDVSGRRKERTFPCITVDPSKKIEKIDIDWGAPH